MITINSNIKSAINQNTILSINIPDSQSIKNQSNIETIMKPQQYYKNTQNINQNKKQEQSTVFKIVDITDRAIPKLQNSIQKGQKAVLPISNYDAIDVCFGWNIKDKRCDVDVSAFLIGQNDKVLGDDWFVFYGQTTSPDKSTILTTEQHIDRQKINIDFSKLNRKVTKIVFVLTINEAIKNQLHFGMIKDAYVRIVNQNKNEIASFIMTEYDTNIISMMIAELYLYNGKWKINAIGNGVTKDLAGVCKWYGVEVV